MSVKKKIILIVEDDRFISGMYKTKLLKEGFGVLQAFDGEEGLILAEKEEPNLIILDILMPKMHGVEVLKRLAASNWGKDIPALILTNLPDYPGVVEFTKKGPYQLLAKAETEPEEVVNKIKVKLKD